MAIVIDKNPDNILLNARYTTILRTKVISQEIFEHYQDLRDDKGILDVFIISREDGFELLISEEKVQIEKSVKHLVKALLTDLSREDLADMDNYDLELEINVTRDRIYKIGLYEIDPIDTDDIEMDDTDDDLPDQDRENIYDYD